MVKKLKKDVWIKIKGIQTVDGESDVTELYTQGSFYEKNGSYYIVYEESETTGYEGCRTILKIDGEEKINMMRKGAVKTNLLIEKDARNIGYYGLPEGDLTIGVSAQKLQSRLDDNGGEVYFKYALDINSSHVSDNEIYVTVGEISE